MKLISWEKYTDPLLEKDLFEPPSTEPTEHSEQELREFDSPDVRQTPPDGRAIFTPLGIMSITDASVLTSHMNLWSANTNFDITESMIEIIEGVEGVESLDTFSRYRFRIGIGRLFNEDSVKQKVQLALKCISNDLELLDNKTRELVVETTGALSDTEYWALFVLPNGKIVKLVQDSDSPNLFEKIRLFIEVQKLVGGVLVHSEKLRPKLSVV